MPEEKKIHKRAALAKMAELLADETELIISLGEVMDSQVWKNQIDGLGSRWGWLLAQLKETA